MDAQDCECYYYTGPPLPDSFRAWDIESESASTSGIFTDISSSDSDSFLGSYEKRGAVKDEVVEDGYFIVQTDEGKIKMPLLNLTFLDNTNTCSTEESSIQRISKKNISYEDWLSYKNKLIAREAAAARQTKHEQELMQQQRRLRSEQEYELWLRRKNEQAKLQRLELKARKQLEELAAARKHEEAERKVNEWHKRKEALKQQEMREAAKTAALVQELMEKRRSLADEAYCRWYAMSLHKPKPVPPCQGWLSLQSTVAKIPKNLVEWQDLV